MNTCITFDNVSFAYPSDPDNLDAEGKVIESAPIFSDFSAELPPSFTFLVGPNGTGKSTFLMLAAGRLIPQQGKCLVFGKDIANLNEEEKNLCASVIYQNMEFESDEKVKNLLSFVYSNGNFKGNKNALKGEGSLLDEVIKEFELENVLEHGLTQISKGEIQRVLLAFSLLYGSESVFMDEPLFAMEDRQKETALAYLRLFSETTQTAFYICMHELDLVKKYALNVMLFYPDHNIDFGSPEEVLTQEALEKSYKVPLAMLKDKEAMNREILMQNADAALKIQKALEK